jgi:hypothetical protein
MIGHIIVTNPDLNLVIKDVTDFRITHHEYVVSLDVDHIRDGKKVMSAFSFQESRIIAFYTTEDPIEQNQEDKPQEQKQEDGTKVDITESVD